MQQTLKYTKSWERKDAKSELINYKRNQFSSRRYQLPETVTIETKVITK